MKGTEQFQNTILTHLQGIAVSDSAFKAKFENPKKSINDCITYILNTVQKSGCNGFADEEIYGMAMHYYDEENIKIGKEINAKVVVNHTDHQGKKVATPQKEKQVQKVKAKPTAKAKPKTVTEPFEQLTMF
jgi:hypothetical protein